MKIAFVYYLALCTSFYSEAPKAATTLTPSSDASSLEIFKAGLINSTLSVPTPQEGFDLTYEIGGPKLRITSCLMNTIAALKVLAVGDWDAKIIDGTEYRLDNYPEVSIIVTTTRRKRNIQARFVVWAISLGVYDMIRKKKFEFAQFELSWEGQVLGWVQVVNHLAGAGLTIEERQANGTLTSPGKSAKLLSMNGTIGPQPVNISNVVTMDRANDPDESRLNVIIEPDGNTLGIYDVFVPVISGLADMAKFSSSRQSSGLMIGLDNYNGFICMLPAIPLRTRPPFLDFGWIIRTITRLPAYMLEKGRFGEVNYTIAVDGVAVGFGKVSTRPDCDPDTSLQASFRVAAD